MALDEEVGSGVSLVFTIPVLFRRMSDAEKCKHAVASGNTLAGVPNAKVDKQSRNSRVAERVGENVAWP